MIEVAVDQSVEKMADVESSGPANRVGITNDVNRAAVAQQVIELRMIGKLVDAREVDQQQLARVRRGSVEAVEVHGLVALIGTYADEDALLTDHLDELE